MSENIKNCPSCGSERHRNKRGQLTCSECVRRRSRQWHLDNKDRPVVRADDYHAKAAERSRIWRENQDELYLTWKGLNDRCNIPTNKDYKKYGLRGISVHKEWRKLAGRSVYTKTENKIRFESFKTYVANNLGPKPSVYHSIDRIDNSGNYEPGNIKWSSPEEQSNNTRQTWKHKNSIPDDSLIWYKDLWMTLVEFSKETGIILNVVKYRYAQHNVTEWIIHWNYDNRHFKYKDHKYNMAELALISGLRYGTIRERIMTHGWSVDDAVHTPLSHAT